MKKNDLQDLKTKTVDELKRMLIDVHDELDKVKIDNSLGKVKNTNEIKKKKKILARVLTFLSIKKLIAEDTKGEAANI